MSGPRVSVGKSQDHAVWVNRRGSGSSYGDEGRVGSGIQVATSLVLCHVDGNWAEFLQVLALTSWCLHQPCLSLADRRTSAWQRWQLRGTGVSAVCGSAGLQGAGSHTAAARPVGEGVWLGASPPGPRGAPASSRHLEHALGLAWKGP